MKSCFSCLYSDNVAQICFQANLCLCYITAIVSLLSNSCTIIISIFLFLSLSAFTFLLVESLIILHKLVDRIMMERLERSVFVVLCGYLPALAYSLLTLPWVSQTLFPSPDHQAGSVDTDNPILPHVLSTCQLVFLDAPSTSPRPPPTC